MLTDLAAYKELLAHKDSLLSLQSLFQQDKRRFEEFHLKAGGLLLDYSRCAVTNETMALLTELARSCNIEDWRAKMFGGAAINNSENRAVLHVALRGSIDNDLEIGGENVSDFVVQTQEQIQDITNAVRGNDAITNIVNIGIGGSDLGPAMVCQALSNHASGPHAHFVSNVDGAHIEQTLAGLDPRSTVFIISSKTFTTQETLTNAQTARNWLIKALGEEAIADHVLAVSNNVEGARDFGIAAENILPMRDWVGGRYSLWGSIGLSISLALGYEHYKALLDGAHAMDKHFCEAPLTKNMPVILALLGVWHRNICDYDALAVLPYAQNLARLPAFLQQLDMESNGKRVTRDGQPVDYATGPLVFGEPGTNGQHAFYQLLHQGTTIVPAEFIAVKEPLSQADGHHNKLLANVLAQADALAFGQDNPQEPHRHFEGNRPSSILVMDKLDPSHLGQLIALYEHKIFVQGLIWGINSFDQWGVELGKTLAKSILPDLENKSASSDKNVSTAALIQHLTTP